MDISNPEYLKWHYNIIAFRDFFSKFCYFIRGVAKDSSHLETELKNIDVHLTIISDKNDDEAKLFLCGPKPSLLDCEVLPKLHQVRVAAAGIKGVFTVKYY